MQIANSDKLVNFYSLGVIISVGYRVKSKQGVVFRKCATNILKDYLLQGYAVNQKRLEYLEKTIKLIDIADRIDQKLNGDEAQEIIRVINNYSNEIINDFTGLFKLDGYKIIKIEERSEKNKIIKIICVENKDKKYKYPICDEYTSSMHDNLKLTYNKYENNKIYKELRNKIRVRVELKN